MKLGFPVVENQGLESRISAHFGRAPHFIIIDTESEEIRTISNHDTSHCQEGGHPQKALAGHQLDAVIVSGIGKHALSSLLSTGCRVYQAKGVSVADNVTCLDHNRLPSWPSI